MTNDPNAPDAPSGTAEVAIYLTVRVDNGSVREVMDLCRSGHRGIIAAMNGDSEFLDSLEQDALEALDESADIGRSMDVDRRVKEHFEEQP